MTDLDIISGTGIAIISSYVTAVILGETTPTINEDGEEEYSIPGYLLLLGGFLVKWAFGNTAKLLEEQVEREEIEEELTEELLIEGRNELIV